MSEDVVILCDKCGNNRGIFIELTTKYTAIAECKKCSNGVIVHFTKKYLLNNEEHTNIR